MLHDAYAIIYDTKLLNNVMVTVDITVDGDNDNTDDDITQKISTHSLLVGFGV